MEAKSNHPAKEISPPRESRGINFARERGKKRRKHRARRGIKIADSNSWRASSRECRDITISSAGAFLDTLKKNLGQFSQSQAGAFFKETAESAVWGCFNYALFTRLNPSGVCVCVCVFGYQLILAPEQTGVYYNTFPRSALVLMSVFFFILRV